MLNRDGGELGLVFPKSELGNIEVMSMIPKEQLKKGENPGTMIRFSWYFNI